MLILFVPRQSVDCHPTCKHTLWLLLSTNTLGEVWLQGPGFTREIWTPPIIQIKLCSGMIDKTD
jgi:hypothetical protein